MKNWQNTKCTLLNDAKQNFFDDDFFSVQIDLLGPSSLQ